MSKLYYFGTSLNQCGHCLFEQRNDELLYSSFELPFNPENYPKCPTHNGYTEFYTFEDWSILAIAGSPADKRPGSKCVFTVNELIPSQELINLIMNTPAAMRIINALPFDVPLIPKTVEKRKTNFQNALDSFDKLHNIEVEALLLSLMIKKKLRYLTLTDQYRVYLEEINAQYCEKNTEILGVAADLLVSNKNQDTCTKALQLIEESQQFQNHVFEEIVEKRFKNKKPKKQ